VVHSSRLRMRRGLDRIDRQMAEAVDHRGRVAEGRASLVVGNRGPDLVRSLADILDSRAAGSLDGHRTVAVAGDDRPEADMEGLYARSVCMKSHQDRSRDLRDCWYGGAPGGPWP